MARKIPPILKEIKLYKPTAPEPEIQIPFDQAGEREYPNITTVQ